MFVGENRAGIANLLDLLEFEGRELGPERVPPQAATAADGVVHRLHLRLRAGEGVLGIGGNQVHQRRGPGNYP